MKRIWLSSFVLSGACFAGCGGFAPTEADASRNASDVGDPPSAGQGATPREDVVALRAPSSQEGAFGGAYGIRPAYESCMTHQPADVSTAGHRQECADQELEFQQARLERAYQSLLAAEKGQRRSLLEARQQVWPAEIESRCAQVASQAESSMGPATLSTCLMEQTAMRAHALERTSSDPSE